MNDEEKYFCIFGNYLKNLKKKLPGLSSLNTAAELKLAIEENEAEIAELLQKRGAKE